jgi:hypothetical protein
MRTGLITAGLCLSLATGAFAQERSTEGIVLMRVAGSITAVFQDGTQREIDNVQIRTGTGTIVSRLGHLVTNEHVVSGREFKTMVGNVRATVTLKVDRVEACFPPSSRVVQSGCVDASVLASDPNLDLAVLTISGNEFPYVPLGDSAAAKTGDPVSAAGYPLGEDLDVGRPPGNEIITSTVAGGELSALRTDDQGNVRYLQTSAPLNPGNSGGPLLDHSGFAIGIIEAKVREATAIGFAIPINIVKEFLARNGVDTFLPSARLTLGYLFDSPEKLIQMQAPAGFEDAGKSRLEVDSGTSIPGVTLRIDRVASPWTLEQLESELLQGRAFDAAPFTRGRSSSRDDRVLRGEAYSHAGARSLRMLYEILDLGDEKLVARYLGSAEQVAFSESVLNASLSSLDAAAMIVPGARSPREPAWVSLAPPNIIPVAPAGWVIDAGGPLPCRAVSVARDSLVTSPRHDFTVSFRLAQHDVAFDGKRAARSCAGARGSTTDNEYRYAFSRLGIEYTVEGRFQPSPNGNGVLQLEVTAPTRKFAVARELFTRWLGESGWE